MQLSLTQDELNQIVEKAIERNHDLIVSRQSVYARRSSHH